MCTVLDLSATPDDAEAIGELAPVSLAPDELETWRSFRLPKRRREWLMGRLAAKEAVRLRLMRSDFPSRPEARPSPPSRREIVVRTDERGRPSAGPAIALSIAHTEGIAVAAVATRAVGIGIDVERLDRRRGDYERGAFTDDERRRLDAGPADRRAERALRLFCAKEAAAKATGLGLMGSPLNLHVVACDAGLERVELRAVGRLAEALPDGDRIPTTVAWVGTRAGLVIALSQRGAGGRP
ncbi:MAG TPA: 4'-phosphopantetheinyl transferase superfamily protein [Verrucomicrobiae bacterium]|nr:4'-phosphopantetheinyl transferase superfamily protein [Verrucomicrobiae bacterium]